MSVWGLSMLTSRKLARRYSLIKCTGSDLHQMLDMGTATREWIHKKAGNATKLALTALLDSGELL